MTVVNVTPPVISGSAVVGNTLFTTNGTWTYDLDYLTYTYQWERCDLAGASCVDIASATNATYLLGSADSGHTIRVTVTATEGSAPVGDKYASPSGSDYNPGTLAAPFQTFAKLISSLSPGQVGMLRAGTYGNSSTYVNVSNSGSSGNPILVTNYPGEKATIAGYIEIYGNYVTLQNLYIDGSNSQLSGPCAPPGYALGLLCQGHHITINRCDVTQSSSTMKGSGIIQHGDANVFSYNKIHDIGHCKAQDHGIYLGAGSSVVIHHNWFWNNAHGWGVQLYPNALGASVHSNVIDHFGSGAVISDTDGGSTSNCDVYNNVVMNEGTTGPSEFSAWSGSAGAGLSGVGCASGASNNKFRDNCCYNNPDGVQSPGQGANVSVTGNITSNPNLANPTAHDYSTTGSTPATVLGYGLPAAADVGPTV